MPLVHDVVHLADHLLAVAEHEGVDEVGEGLRVVCGVASPATTSGSSPDKRSAWRTGTPARSIRLRTLV